MEEVDSVVEEIATMIDEATDRSTEMATANEQQTAAT